MPCVGLNVSMNVSSLPIGNKTDEAETDTHLFFVVDDIIDKYVTHYICLFGIIGNLVNLLVLTRKSLTAQMERMEKSSHVGLIALAVSDLFFCLASFPDVWNTLTFGSSTLDFWFVYNVYGNAVINCFLLSSSWLTVAMAVCRYLAICRPLSCSHYLGMTSTRITIVAVFWLSIIFNLPRFWTTQIYTQTCDDGSQMFYPVPGYMKQQPVLETAYRYLYFIVGILVPFVVLVYCNVFLVRALRESRRFCRQHSTSSSCNPSATTRVVTQTLCAIVVLYVVLVLPAELLTFSDPFLHERRVTYGVAVKVCNALQMVNFAVNFLLYCVMNVRFRRVVRDFVLCHVVREQISSMGDKTTHQQMHVIVANGENIAMV